MSKTLIFLLTVLLVLSGISWAECPKADVNSDCKVNLEDLAIMASEWLEEGIPDPDDNVIIYDTYPATSSRGWGVGTDSYFENAEIASQFQVTGGNFTPHTISVTGYTTTGQFMVRLYKDAGDVPGDQIIEWGPNSFTANNSPGSDLTVYIHPNVLLHNGSKYWLALVADDSYSKHVWMHSTSDEFGLNALRYVGHPDWSVRVMPGAGDSHVAAFQIKGTKLK